MSSIKIETLQIRNFKRVKIAEVSFSPDGLTVIGGANGQGKSTFLDAIKYAIGGGKYQPTQPHNLEAGGATAIIRAKLNNGIEVERKGKDGTLKVTVPSGKGNQATLNEFLNEFALDIGKFMRAGATDKTKMLIQHLGIGDKLEFLDAKVKKLFDERTLVNREVERKKQFAESLPTYDRAPAERVEITELRTEMKRMQAENQELEVERIRLENIRQNGIAARARITALQQQIAELQAKLEAEQSDYTEKGNEYRERKQALESKEPHDLTAIEQRIADADRLNAMLDANQKAKAAAKEAEQVAKEAQALTDSIEEARAQRIKLLEEIQMPLDGLGIEEGQLIYRGQQWDNMSGSERLRVATAISRAFKPECGFVLVDELEQLDWKTIQSFHEWAKTNGIQIIGAMVCDEDKASENVIIIEDGMVKA